MIALKLQLRNFLCYRDDVPLLDLSDIHVDVLSGENGAGKSALLDAITWVLWGRSRARSDDELVSLGRQEAEVDFEFSLEHHTYRLIRKHSKKGRGRTWLEFQVLSADLEWQPLTGNSIRETQAKIIELVKMDYETFINSAFIVQGRANEFTSKSPGERKRILAEILSLSYYDSLERRAKDEAQIRQLERMRLEERLAELEAHIAAKPAYEDQARQTAERIGSLEAGLGEMQAELDEQKGKRLVLDLSRRQLEDLEVQWDILQDELERREDEIVEHRDRISALEEMLAHRDEVMTGYRRLEAARKTNDELTGKVSQLMLLTEESHRLEGAIERARDRLVLDQEAYVTLISRAGGVTSRLVSLDTEISVVRAEKLSLAERERELDELRRRRESLSQTLAQRQADAKNLETEIGRLSARLSALSSQSCPLCGSALEAERKERLWQDLDQERRLKEEFYRLSEIKIGETQRQIEEVSGQLVAQAEIWKQLLHLERRQAELDKAFNDARQADMEQASAQMKLIEIGRRLTRGDYAAEEQAILQRVLGQLDRLDYNGDRHEVVRQEVQELAEFEAARSELEAAEQRLALEVQDLHRAVEARTRTLDLLDDGLKRKEALLAELGGRDVLDREIADLTERVKDRQDEIDDARSTLGALRQRAEDCVRWEVERKASLAEHRRVAGEESVYNELALAFGPRGVQAMIIEDAIPEIEREANALLGRMTDERMRLRFETQRDAKRGGTIETLDIVISDELGSRSYELFSGGEAFRIDFAVRIALSKLLARRAGAKLQTLVLDEGFGTQDGPGRERLVEAIEAIQDDFAVILVVTHIEELKDFFPVRIDVFKTPSGSQIVLN